MSTSVAHILGRQISASALRPEAKDELAQWGGPEFLRGKRVMDLGCGDGRLALGVAPYAAQVTGVDPDDQLIKAATDRAARAGVRNARFVTGAGQELPFPDASFDVVILSWTL